MDKLHALQHISYEDFILFSDQLLKKTYVEGVLYGNLEKNEAEGLWTSVKKTLKSEDYPPNQQHNRSVLHLKEGEGPYMILQSTPMLGNAVVLMLEEGPYSFEKRASQQVLGKVLKDAFFDTLRTKQQTAYIAKAWDVEEEKQLLQFFAVQSSTHQPSELIARFELFLEDFVKQFTTKLEVERFENVRKMAIKTLQIPPENLERMAGRLFLLGFNCGGDFNFIEKRIEALEKLTYEQLRHDAIDFLSRSNSKRIAVLVEGLTPKEKEFRYQMLTKEALLEHGSYLTKKESEELANEGAVLR
jgi:insulysin